ncbi:hypothetical protein GCM10009795_017470 [Nocardioides hankookensis]|uniref:ABM domain-containing protein n=1 Tax=Nocardioides hankookensis TaxID=443157 RepID=A0ABW1LJ04_9ACTN
MTRLVVRYRVRPECAEENRRLVRAVFAELAELRPAGVAYQSAVLEDGVTFVHQVDGDSAVLRELPAFQRFAWTVGERCEDPPVQSSAQVVGAYDGRRP